MNYFHTSRKDIDINGDADGITVDNGGEQAELLLADLEREFHDVKINGHAAGTRPVDIGGKLFTVVETGKGRSILSWRTRPRRTVISGDFRPVVAGNRIETGGDGPNSTTSIAAAKSFRAKDTWFSRRFPSTR